jgi:hypothetical protein
MATNLEQLKKAGLIHKTLPKEYKNVVEGLTPLEVDVLVAVARRLKAADECRQPGEPGYTTFMTF